MRSLDGLLHTRVSSHWSRGFDRAVEGPSAVSGLRTTDSSGMPHLVPRVPCQSLASLKIKQLRKVMDCLCPSRSCKAVFLVTQIKTRTAAPATP